MSLRSIVWRGMTASAESTSRSTFLNVVFARTPFALNPLLKTPVLKFSMCVFTSVVSSCLSER